MDNRQRQGKSVLAAGKTRDKPNIAENVASRSESIASGSQQRDTSLSISCVEDLQTSAASSLQQTNNEENKTDSNEHSSPKNSSSSSISSSGSDFKPAPFSIKRKRCRVLYSDDEDSDKKRRRVTWRDPLTETLEIPKKITTKPYKCDQCDGSFKSVSLLNRHREAHFNRFDCSHCSKSYKRKDSLTEHIQGAHEGKRWECGKCGKKFKARASRTTHQKTCVGHK